MTEFHLQAGIASLHCAAATYEQTDWAKIVELYTELYRMSPSPTVALNRAVALGKARGPEEGLCALRKIVDAEQLREYPFYSVAQGEFLLLTGRPEGARAYFEKAEKLARSRSKAGFFGRKIKPCQPGFAQVDVPGR